MLSARSCLLLAALSAALAIALAEGYRAVGMLLGTSAWEAAAALHSVLAVGVVVALFLKGRADLLLPSGGAPGAWIWMRGWRAYLPAVVVVVGVSLLCLGSRSISPGGVMGGVPAPYAWIVWVPLVEELVFRGGIGQAFRRFAPAPWAAWFAALTFGLVHTQPTVANVLAGQIGLPLGPFLLGLACEAVVGTSGRLGPAVALHAACNATVSIFGYADARWLDWLGIFYT